MSNIKRLELTAHDRSHNPRVLGSALSLSIESRKLSETTRWDTNDIPALTAGLARCLYWIARIGGKLGYSLDELARLAVEEELV